MVGITSPDTTATFRVIIETVIDGELDDSPITECVPSVENDATLVLTNNGNALSDYTLSTSGLPGWVVNLRLMLLLHWRQKLEHGQQALILFFRMLW